MQSAVTSRAKNYKKVASSHQLSLQVGDLLLAVADVALKLRGHLFLLVQLNLRHPDVFLQLVEALLGLFQLVTFGL